MASPSPDRTTEWEGGSLGELVSVLQAAALPVRIEVIAPGTMGSNAGEVHLLAGGLADAFAGSLRRDDAMAALQRLEGARFVVESRLPNPETGSLAEPGPREGSLKDRPLASLMRYCEDYVLTCRLEIQRGQEKAVISYQRGEIAGTTVDGKDDEENLPGVLAWPDGSYEIVLPAPVLPPIPARKRDMLNAGRISEAGTKPERKRHGTLPMAPAAQAAPPPVLAYPARMVPAPTAPFEPVKPSAVVQTPAEPQDAASTAPFEPVKPAAVVQTHAEPAAAAPSPPSQPAPRPSIPPLSALHLPFSSQPAAPAPQAPVRSPEPVMAGQPPAAPAEPFPPETTKRGIPTLPPVPPVPQPAARPATQGLPAPSVRGKLAPPTVPKPAPPAVQGKPAAPAAPKPAPPAAAPTLSRLATAPAAAVVPPKSVPPTAVVSPRPAAFKPAPPATTPTLSRQAAPPAGAVAPPRPAAQPSPAAVVVPPKPASPATAAAPPKPVLPTTAAVPPKPAEHPSPAAAVVPSKPAPSATAVVPPKPAPPAAAAAAPKPATAPPSTTAHIPPKLTTPPATPVAPAAPRRRLTPALPTTVPIAGQAAENQPVPPALVAKQPLAPPASYDLRPRSGTIEARAKRASPVRPAVGPIEVANEPAPALPPSEPEVLHPQPSIPRRSRASARKEPVERPVRVYVFVGLAIGVGIVLAYWLYWSLPFGHG